MGVELGVRSPIVTATPGGHQPWEREATVEDLARVAETADRLGYHHLTCSEHVGVPVAEAERRGATYWDPLATFGYLAARTSRIRFATFVLVLGYHHPLAIAKRYGTLDRISGGRLVLGVGVGSLEAEFDLLGAPFADRGERADDALRALRAVLSDPKPTHHGRFIDVEGFVVDPCAVQDRVPLWVGGRTRRSLRRAVELADGWCPFAVRPSVAADWLAEVDVPDGFEVLLPPKTRLDPSGAPEHAREVLAATAACGATIISADVVHHSLDHLLEQLEALAEVHPPGG